MKVLFVILLLISTVKLSIGQFYNGMHMTFGKNRVQYYDEQIWQLFRFDKFDTYFYQNGRELAIYSAKYAIEVIPEIEEKLEYFLNTKIQFIIFNSLNDFKESNIGLITDEKYNIGGTTRVIGQAVILYFQGNYRDFERQIRQGIATVLVNNLVFGERLGSNITSSALMNLPEWYTEGLISFIAHSRNTEIDNTIRDGILSGKFDKFNSIIGEDAIIAGHSIWQFISNRYGDHVISNIIYMTKVSRNVENGFLYVLGMSFKTVINEWYMYYYQKYNFDNHSRKLTEADINIPVRHRKNTFYHQFKISPCNVYLAYATDNLTKKHIWLYNLQTGKRKKIYRTGHKLDDDRDHTYPLISWHPSGDLLAFIAEEKGLTELYLYEIENKNTIQQSIFGVDKVLNFSYSPDVQSMVMSCVQNGKTNIYVYMLASRTFQNITKDSYDDLYPVFVNNGRYIAFSSNRIHDTIQFERETYIRDYSETLKKSPFYNIFLYDYKNQNPILWRITENKANDAIIPQPLQNDHISYIDDNSGIFNRYIAKIDSVISYIDTAIHYRYFAAKFPVTNYPRNIVEHNINEKGNYISEIVYKDNKYNLRIVNKLDANESRMCGTNPQNTSFQNAFEISNIIPEEQQIKQPVETIEKRDTVDDKQSYPLSPSDSLDINNYRFRTHKPESIIKTKDLPKEKTDTTKSEFVLPNQRNYDVEYFINSLISQVDYNFLNYSYQTFTGGGPIFLGPGINALIKIGVNDLLENYRIIGGVRFAFDFRNNEYFLGYENLSRRLNKQMIFHRQGYETTQKTSFIKHRLHNYHYILTYPFNRVLALKGSFMLRHDQAHYLASDFNNLNEPGTNNFWSGMKGELIFDNTRSPQLNINFGTRFKIWAEYYQYIHSDQKNLIVAGFDFRNYLPIHRNFIWANRFAGSTSMGNSKLIFYLGGVDTWLFPKFNDKIDISYHENYAFQTLATNMRGFTQNIRNGNSFVVYNSEFRLPLIQYLFNRPLQSEILNNFQVVGFGDLGVAWEGLNPLSEDNKLFTHIVQQGPILVIVKRQKDPIVGGYGFGLRTKLLGYFIRADYAWGVEDLIIKKPVFYLSLSLDF